MFIEFDFIEIEGVNTMSRTFMLNRSRISRSRYIIDASGLPLGRLSAQVASILRGKVKPIFVSNVDCGDFVTVVNCDKVVLTGKKWDNKKRYRHTGYIGHLKTIKYSDLRRNDPCKAVKLAVRGMLPSTTLGRAQLKRLNLQVGNVVKDAENLKSWTNFRKVRIA